MLFHVTQENMTAERRLKQGFESSFIKKIMIKIFHQRDKHVGLQCITLHPLHNSQNPQLTADLCLHMCGATSRTVKLYSETVSPHSDRSILHGSKCQVNISHVISYCWVFFFSSFQMFKWKQWCVLEMWQSL